MGAKSAICFIAAAALAAAIGAEARAQQTFAYRLQPSVIVDASGFEQPMGASTLFIPHGWRAEGGVFWAQQFMCTNGYAIEWRATSPDGSMAVAILPSEKWESNNYGAGPSTPGCQSAPYTNVRQYLEALVQRRRPGARVIDYRTRPDLQQEFAALNSSSPMPAGEIRSWVEAGEALLAFSENGRDMRASVTAVAVFNLSRANYGTGNMDALTGYVFPVYAATAPNGQLNAALFEAIRRSIKINPQWERRIAGHNAAIGKVALEESRKRAAAIAQSNEEIARIRNEAWSAYQESADRRAHQFGELIRGVETYGDADAPGGTVELSHNYNEAWRLIDGSYVLTNDPNFEPWRDLQMEGRKLEPAR